jgi:hypothetical protein
MLILKWVIIGSENFSMRKRGETIEMRWDEISCDNCIKILVREFLLKKHLSTLVRACASIQHLRIIFRCRQLNQFFFLFRFFYSINLLAFFFYSSLLVTNIFLLFTILSSVVVHCYIIKKKPVSNAHTNDCLLYRSATKFFSTLSLLDDTKN